VKVFAIPGNVKERGMPWMIPWMLGAGVKSNWDDVLASPNSVLIGCIAITLAVAAFMVGEGTRFILSSPGDFFKSGKDFLALLALVLLVMTGIFMVRDSIRTVLYMVRGRQA
jgi:hypothetical protein